MAMTTAAALDCRLLVYWLCSWSEPSNASELFPAKRCSVDANKEMLSQWMFTSVRGEICNTAGNCIIEL